MKEGDVDRERRRASAEKQKSAKDMEKKKEKKKNLEWQALEKHHANSRREGEFEEDSLDEDEGNEGDDDSDDSEGMAARLDKILEGSPDTSRDRRQEETSSRRSRADSPLPPRKVALFLHPNLLRATGSKPWRRGR